MLYLLGRHPQQPFPHASAAETTPNGLLAVGGDLSVPRLLNAYRSGIFPWFNDEDPLLWWSPDPRAVLFPERLIIHRSLAKTLKRSGLHVTRDQTFASVIEQCAATRAQGPGTWITQPMREAYRQLYALGTAHSVEVWQDGMLVGGLYGIALGRAFFGESMFSASKSASQFALIELLRFLKTKNFQMVDCQMTTNHLLRFGAREISGHRFRACLKEYINDIDRHELRCTLAVSNDRPSKVLTDRQPLG